MGDGSGGISLGGVYLLGKRLIYILLIIILCKRIKNAGYSGLQREFRRPEAN